MIDILYSMHNGEFNKYSNITRFALHNHTNIL